MNYQDILTLAKSGFTADQISILARAEAAAQPQPAQPASTTPVQAPAPAQMQVQTPAAATTPAIATAPAQTSNPTSTPAMVQTQVQAPEPNPVQNQSTIDDVMKQLGLMQNAMQGQALAFAQQPKEQSVDDILAEIINPPEPEKKA